MQHKTQYDPVMLMQHKVLYDSAMLVQHEIHQNTHKVQNEVWRRYMGVTILLAGLLVFGLLAYI